MLHTDLIKGLRRCKPSLVIPTPDAWGCWYPGKHFGMTSVWLDTPVYDGRRKERARKVCSFHLGMVPEFTQVGPTGGIIRRGWRSILDKLVKSRAVTKNRVERVFRVSLDREGTDSACPTCRADGKVVKRDGKSQYCLLHRQIDEQIAMAKQASDEGAYLANRH